jgi:peptide/nickel transport system permease protein
MSLANELDVSGTLVRTLPLLERRHITLLAELMSERKAAYSSAVLLVLVFLAVFARPVEVAGVTVQPFSIAPYDPVEPNYGNTFAAPSLDHPFGTDSFGRDVLSRIISAARISLFVGLGTVGAAMVAGIPVGLLAGYYSTSIVETIIMRIMDAVLAFPGIILALMLVSVLGSSVTNVVIALSIGYVPSFARIAHGATLSIKEEEFITSARAVGTPTRTIIARYLLPNAIAPLIVQATLVFAFAILGEAGLSFLGVGAQPPTPSLGLMIIEGKDYLDQSVWISLFPGLAIMTIVLSLNFLGDALRDVLDPKQETDRRPQ